MSAPAISVAQPTPLATNRNFRLLWLGEGVSVLGSMTTTVVFPLIAVTEFSAGPLAMGQPRPDRVQHRLAEEEDRGLEDRHVAHPAGEEDVGQADLDRPEVGHRHPVARGGLPDGEGEGERDGEGERVARHHGRERGGAVVGGRPAAAQPPEADEREGPGEARRQGEQVAGRRVGRGADRRPSRSAPARGPAGRRGPRFHAGERGRWPWPGVTSVADAALYEAT